MVDFCKEKASGKFCNRFACLTFKHLRKSSSYLHLNSLHFKGGGKNIAL